MTNRGLQRPFVKAEKDDLYQRSQETDFTGFEIAIKYFIYKYQSVEVVKNGEISVWVI